MQTQTSSTSLSPGTLIGRYEIREVLGIGGFGITYKANDTKLKRLVAIKEYLPAETAVRAHHSSTVNAYESRADEYQYGLSRFLDEAKTLAKFHHPNIIGVLDHLELNNTAYLIMTYEQGQTLSQLLKQQSKIPEQELKAIVKAILTGLQHIHEQDYYHRDIKPGNIYLSKQGEPLLIDFGAARQAIGTRSRSLINIVSAGYAPSEQYGSNESKQGPWSDLYAVGATMYKSISGQEPVDAPTRSSELVEGDPDPLTPATQIGNGHYTAQLLQLIDWMLTPAIKNRPQNVTQVIARLEHAHPTQEANSTAATVINQEARSTTVTEVIRQQDTQHPHIQNRYQQTKQRQAEKDRLAAQKIKIGSKGPGGGIVFYIDSSGKHGLEAKKADAGGGKRYKWGEAMTAAKSSGSGWHLPSKRELNLLYQQKDVVGGFADLSYWSSTESGSGEAWEQYFYNGNQNDNNKNNTNRVRAVRGFK